MFDLISGGMIRGVGAGTTPGPLLSFLIITTLSRGWRVGLQVIFAPFLTDIPIIIVMTFLLSTLSDDVVNAMNIIGGIFVFYIAWGSWRQLQSGEAFVVKNEDVEVGETVFSWRTLSKAAMMNLISPGPYLYWGTVNGPLLRDGLDQSVWHGIAFLIAFYGTFLGIMALLVLLFDRLRTVDERVTNGIMLIGIVVMMVLGVSLIGNGLGINPIDPF